uniref:Uncharacterized protein n=1 Tax=Monodon monoceros TaxID=40151 RepID=A0A8C6APU0_MONMO
MKDSDGFFPSAFQAKASSQPCISCQLWFSEPSPEWRTPSHTHHTRQCRQPHREWQRRCRHHRSRCLPDTWTSQHRRCAHSVSAAPLQGSLVSSSRAQCCLRSAVHTCLGQPPAA